jgi:hypothetical protein
MEAQNVRSVHPHDDCHWAVSVFCPVIYLVILLMFAAAGAAALPWAAGCWLFPSPVYRER